MEPLAPNGYAQFLADLKSRIQAAQVRASLSVNRELVLFCWQIVLDILERQDRERWVRTDFYFDVNTSSDSSPLWCQDHGVRSCCDEL